MKTVSLKFGKMNNQRQINRAARLMHDSVASQLAKLFVEIQRDVRKHKMLPGELRQYQSILKINVKAGPR